MFDVASSEFLLVVLVALVVIGPKDLPRVLRVVGKWVGKARGVAAQFRSGFDEMVRQSELEELEKKWKAENDRIIRDHPTDPRTDMANHEMQSTESDLIVEPTASLDVPAKS
jgi:sec-independent protein translocase protein TatB